MLHFMSRFSALYLDKGKMHAVSKVDVIHEVVTCSFRVTVTAMVTLKKPHLVPARVQSVENHDL